MIKFDVVYTSRLLFFPPNFTLLSISGLHLQTTQYSGFLHIITPYFMHRFPMQKPLFHLRTLSDMTFWSCTDSCWSFILHTLNVCHRLVDFKLSFLLRQSDAPSKHNHVNGLLPHVLSGPSGAILFLIKCLSAFSHYLFVPLYLAGNKSGFMRSAVCCFLFYLHVSNCVIFFRSGFMHREVSDHVTVLIFGQMPPCPTTKQPLVRFLDHVKTAFSPWFYVKTMQENVHLVAFISFSLITQQTKLMRCFPLSSLGN